MNQDPGLRYACTNECLRGIVLGLDLSEKDSVLTVAGSGDQAFAFLEFARRVKAIDVAPEQIEFMRKKVDMLRKGDYDAFLETEVVGSYDGYISGQYISQLREFNKDRRKKYFAEHDVQRLERIRANLGNLVIAEPANILETQTEDEFSKIYLSNILGYGNNVDGLGVTQILSDMASNIPIGGLIYVANHDMLIRLGRTISLFDKDVRRENKENIKDLDYILDRNKDLEDGSFLPPNLKVDMDLSGKVRRCEEGGFWKPAVYRQVDCFKFF